MRIFGMIIPLFVVLLPSCKPDSKPSDDLSLISFEVKADDLQRNLYYVQWHDTLGQAEEYTGSKWVKRPQGIWCVITNKNNDTLGRYTGLSTAQNFADFQSRDSIVTFHFMMGVNFFSDQFADEKDVARYAKELQLPRKYRAVQVDIRKELNKLIKITLGMSSL